MNMRITKDRYDSILRPLVGRQMDDPVFADPAVVHNEIRNARCNAVVPHPWKGLRHEIDSLRVEIESARRSPWGFDIFARAWLNDKQLGFGADGSVDIERFHFFNPPLLHSVSDGPIQIGKRLFRSDPRAAMLETLAQAVGTVGKVGADISPGKRGNTTYTIYGSTADGIIDSVSGVYTTARSGGSFTVNTSSTSLSYIGQYLEGASYHCFEAFLRFDTSAVAGTISAATLNIFVGDLSTVSGGTLNARRRNFSTTLASGDWVAGASVSGNTLIASKAFNSMTGDARNDLTSEAAFLTNINQSGNTDIMLTTARFEAGTTPTTYEMTNCVAADETGTTDDPRLTIEAAAANNGNGFLLL